MENNYKKEAVKLLKANKWTDNMIGKAFGVPANDREELRKRIMNVLPADLRKQIDYLSTYSQRNKSVINEKVSVIRKLRNEFPFSFPEIGLLLRRNHSTIMHHYQSSIKPLRIGLTSA